MLCISIFYDILIIGVLIWLLYWLVKFKKNLVELVMWVIIYIYNIYERFWVMFCYLLLIFGLRNLLINCLLIKIVWMNVDKCKRYLIVI